MIVVQTGTSTQYCNTYRFRVEKAAEQSIRVFVLEAALSASTLGR